MNRIPRKRSKRYIHISETIPMHNVVRNCLSRVEQEMGIRGEKGRAGQSMLLILDLEGFPFQVCAALGAWFLLPLLLTILRA